MVEIYTSKQNKNLLYSKKNKNVTNYSNFNIF